MIGLALQLVCGLAAVRVVRALLRLAARAGRALALATAGPRQRPPFRPRFRPQVAEPLRLVALAGCAAGRAPAPPGLATVAMARRGAPVWGERSYSMNVNGTGTVPVDLDALADALAARMRESVDSTWMNTAEAADYMRVSERWVRQHLAQVPHSKVQGKLFFSRRELDAWLQRNRRE